MLARVNNVKTRLNIYSFKKVGHWVKSKDGRVTFQLTHNINDRVIYAFVNEVNGDIYYIGICDNPKTTLKKRLERYKYRQGGSTNARILNNLDKVLKDYSEVAIYTLKPSNAYRYLGLQVDLVRGLEYPLINMFRPKWNRTGT